MASPAQRALTLFFLRGAEKLSRETRESHRYREARASDLMGRVTCIWWTHRQLPYRSSFSAFASIYRKARSLHQNARAFSVQPNQNPRLPHWSMHLPLAATHLLLSHSVVGEHSHSRVLTHTLLLLPTPTLTSLSCPAPASTAPFHVLGRSCGISSLLSTALCSDPPLDSATTAAAKNTFSFLS